MSRRGFSGFINSVAREVARAERANQREATRQRVALARELRNEARLTKLRERQEKQDYLHSRAEEAQQLTQEIRDRELAISCLLSAASKKAAPIFVPASKTFYSAPLPQFGRIVKPELDDFPPEPLSFFSKIFPGANKRHQTRKSEAHSRFEEALADYNKKLALHASRVEQFRSEQLEARNSIDRHNEEVQALTERLAERDHDTIVCLYQRTLEESFEQEIDAVAVEVGYAPDSRHLVVDLELPDISIIPEEIQFRYNKGADQVQSTLRPAGKRRALYANLLCQIALKSVATVLRAEPKGAIDCLTLNGMIDAIDPGTGQQIRACLLSVRVTSDAFSKLVLEQVQPEECLRGLKASVSRAPEEFLPVKPFVELDMFDSRFIATTEVLSSLEQRPNLMDLTPSEFEGLITQLFATMGLDTRQTRASRDGGVDCVAFDSRPIFGGKVVIQAKRYKNTVGVSAVRDLFGTVQNEGASKGILVTTSGYGKAAFEFAKGKPLELLDGPNLLHLLSEHAKLDARIIMPDDWIDQSNSGD